MTLREHIRLNFKLGWPVMLGQLGHVMVGLADSLMVGQLGTIPLAAAAFGNSIFVVPLVFGIGMAYGLTPPIANADGAGDRAKIGVFLKNSLFLNGITSLLLVAIVFALRPLTIYMGQAEEVRLMALPYLDIVNLSMLPLMLFLTLKQFAEGLSDTRMAMYISLGANVLNVVLNYCFIYGLGPIPAMGLNGAAIATLISRIIMAGIMVYYIAKSPRFKSVLQQFRQLRLQRFAIDKLLRLGMPSGFQHIFEVSAFAGAAILVGTVSPDALAAHQIAISLAAISYMAASGLAAAASVRTGNQLGKRAFGDMVLAGRSAMVLSMLIMLASGIAFILGRDLFPTLYSDSESVLQIAASLLIIAAIFQLSDGIQVVALGALRGISDVNIPTLITLIAYWPLGLGLGYWLGITQNMGAVGIWIGLAAGLSFAALGLYLRFEYTCKVKINEERLA